MAVNESAYNQAHCDWFGSRSRSQCHGRRTSTWRGGTACRSPIPGRPAHNDVAPAGQSAVRDTAGAGDRLRNLGWRRAGGRSLLGDRKAPRPRNRLKPAPPPAPLAPRVSVSYERCTLVLVGVEMSCPLCGQRVPAGTHHECERNRGITARWNQPTDTPLLPTSRRRPPATSRKAKFLEQLAAVNDKRRPVIQRLPTIAAMLVYADAHLPPDLPPSNGYLPPGEKAMLIAAAQYPRGSHARRRRS